MTPPNKLQCGLSRTHWLWMLSLLVAGAVAAFFILRTPSGASASAGHDEAHGAEHGKSHDKDHAPASGEAHEHGEKSGHDDHDGDHSQDRQAERKKSAPAGHDEIIALTPAQITAAGIELAQVAPARMQTLLSFPGEIRFNEDRTAHIVPRAAAVVQAVQAELGQRVRKGQVLAELSSNTVSDLRAERDAARQRVALARATYERELKLWREQISPEQDVQQARQALREAEISANSAQQKLQTLDADAPGLRGGHMALRAPFDGIVVEKHLSLGEAVQESTQAFTVADLSTVWAELKVPARELEQVRVGEPARVRSIASGAEAEGKVAYVGMLIGEQTRTAPARVTLANPQLAWRPGLFVQVELSAGDSQAPATVSEAALQTLDGRAVVFVQVEGGFRAQPVEVGRRSQGRVEILKGLQPGEVHAATGSFTIKAEQGKAEATHSH